MRTTLEQVTELYAIINNSPLKTAIDGDIYKLWRPVDSSLEDVVINSIVIDNELIQTSVANINIYVPGLINGMPNSARMETLAILACNFLKEGTDKRFTFFVESQEIFKEMGLNLWFVNIRIKFKFHNTILN